MIDESMDTEHLKKDPQPWEFRSKPAWQRLIIMLGGVTVNIILGFAIYVMITFVWGKTILTNEIYLLVLKFQSLSNPMDSKTEIKFYRSTEKI